MSIDRLPSGRFRGRLMINGQRYSATLPSEDDARSWEIQTRATVAMRRRAASVTFAAYAARWLAQFLDDEPDRARFEAALKDRLLPVLGALPLPEVLDADRDDVHHRLGDTGGEDDTAFECLGLILEDAIHELRAGALDVRARVDSGRAGR